MAMNMTIEQALDALLEQHIVHNGGLLELIKKERDSIIHNELKQLEAINEQKCVLKDAIAAIEAKRLVLMEQFIERYGFSEHPIRLQDVIRAVAEPFKSSYEKKRAKLKVLLQTISVAHAGNRKLIQKSLNFHEKSFMLLFGLTKEKVGYAASGKATHTPKRLIDNIV